MNFEEVNCRPELGGKTGTKCALLHPIITQKLGKEKVRACVHFIPVPSLFGIHLFLVDKNYYPSIIQLLFENIHLSHYGSLVVHFWIVITHFVLVDYTNILNLK